MNMNFFKGGATAVILSAATLFGATADAATMYEGTYKATSVNTGGNDHTVWLPGLFGNVNAYWQFAPEDGKFKVGENNETAHLTGRIQNNVSTNLQMDVDVSYVLRTPNVPGDTVKQGGGTYDGTWSFFDISSAIMTGVGDLEGLTLTLSAFPNPDVEDIPFQLGDGANDKNGGLGGAGWFSWFVEVTDNYNGPDWFNSVDLGAKKHGDININLAPVPVPAAGLLLLAGLGGLGAMRMRKKAS
jgi:hypothetical protein